MDPLELSFEDLTFGEEKPKATNNPNVSNNLSTVQTQSTKTKEELHELPIEPNVVLVSTVYGGKLNFQTVLKQANEKCGPLKNFSHKENQHFCFLQFEDAEGVENALSKLNNTDIDGYKLSGLCLLFQKKGF